ncbi:HlyC/CorC family transporter [Solilutibacter tolerans]|uniref:Magnesium and cobalt efflux protein CorC n=1 Tax=Solilutibacter tolerans TaxID=1604334 RepID=A0A1N6NPE0_9GAMM|nr:transporter associated domain-containing protein [Lysobacter tolerans]SIP93949.1 magnesium and cobalt transporter [Lysobacter tolerans]
MSEEPDSTSPSTEPRSWLKRLGAAFSGEPTTRGDVLEFLRDAEAEGLLDADTTRMMEGAIAVSELTVGDVMIPRAQMTMIQIDEPMREVIATAVESGHSRFPVHGEDKDQILGILLAKDLLKTVVAESPISLHDLLRPAFLIPESKRLDLLLREFRLSRNHMAIVIDEYGGVAGVVTIEDVLEQIVGDIDDEHDEAEEGDAQIAAQPDGQYVVDALTPIDDFNERFGADFNDDEYDTIGGLVTAAIGHLPEAGEELTMGRFVFRVANADARRVHAFHVGVLGDA